MSNATARKGIRASLMVSTVALARAWKQEILFVPFLDPLRSSQ
jgi:hypothetical protein